MANADGNTQTRPEITPQQPAFAESIATLLKKPQGAAMDLFQALDICLDYADGLLANDNHTECMALCGRLYAGLQILKSALKAPLPDRLIESMTLKEGDTSDCRTPLTTDPETLCEYSEALTIVLLNNQEQPEQREQMIGILYEMIALLSEDLKAPRFIRTAGELKTIEGEALPGVH